MTDVIKLIKIQYLDTLLVGKSLISVNQESMALTQLLFSEDLESRIVDPDFDRPDLTIKESQVLIMNLQKNGMETTLNKTQIRLRPCKTPDPTLNTKTRKGPNHN